MIMTRSFLTSSLSCSGTIFELVLSVTFQEEGGRGGEGGGEREMRQINRLKLHTVESYISTVFSFHQLTVNAFVWSMCCKNT